MIISLIVWAVIEVFGDSNISVLQLLLIMLVRILLISQLIFKRERGKGLHSTNGER